MRSPAAHQPVTRRALSLRSVRARAAALTLLGAGLAAAMLAAGCTAPTRIERPQEPALLPPEVDSLVVLPFERAPGVKLAPVELELLARHLGEALGKREQLRVFDKPPTKLPNTVRLAGRLEALTVNERSADGLQLRTVDLAAEVQVLPMDGDKPLAVLRRRTARQKAYAGVPMSALALDLEDAMRELTAQFAQALAPLPGPDAVALRLGARDPVHPALARGNAAAAHGDFDRARLDWLAVLFNPAPGNTDTAYRIGPAVLNQLRAAGVPADVVQRLAPLAGRDEASLVDFRRAVRGVLGEAPDYEARILTLSEVHVATASANLAAAHANLAALAALEARDDLAAYHLARAWAYDPVPALLEPWRDLQARRKVLPRNLGTEEALRLYLSIPAPATARVQPGAFARTVLPPPAFGEDTSEAVAAQGGTEQGAQPAPPPAAAPSPEAAPAASAPPAGPADGGTATGTAPAADATPAADAGVAESTPGRAAGGGPSESTSAAEGPAPAAPAQPAPANQ